MMLPDRLMVTGIGENRQKVLEDADQQAAVYFGDTKHMRLTARAEVTERSIDGKVIAFEAIIEYEAARQ